MQTNPDPASGAPRRSTDRRQIEQSITDPIERRAAERRSGLDRRGAARG